MPPRRANRKGVVEKSIHYLTQRWWRTARVRSIAEAQASFDAFCVRIADRRDRGGVTVAEAAATEGLRSLPPVGYPATITVERTVAANALVSFDGNRYSVPPGLVRTTVTVRARLGADTIDIVAASGAVVATHRRAPKGAGRTTSLPEHSKALENVVLGAFSTDRPCNRKANRPPSDAALALAAGIGDAARDPVIDLAVYQRAIDGGAR